jgi:hypothetical protein
MMPPLTPAHMAFSVSTAPAGNSKDIQIFAGQSK